MKTFWYLPVAAVVGATSLTVWGQANAGPPTGVPPGVVVTADVQLIPAELQTLAPTQTTDSPTHDFSDDKGGLRDEGASDDAPGDDKGGER